MSNITIYHNPTCGTSRNVLALIRNSGEEPNVIEYLKTPPDRETLQRLITDMGAPMRAVLRVKGTPYAELGLDDPKWGDEQLIGFMLQHPILINRPIVVTPLGTRLCRPSEAVLDILPQPQRGAFLGKTAKPWWMRRVAGSETSRTSGRQSEVRLVLSNFVIDIRYERNLLHVPWSTTTCCRG